MRHSTARRRIAAGLLTTLALAGTALVAQPASAATPTSVLYSTDGGTTWTASPTVAPGGTVLVRQWFDNTNNLHATAASVTTTLPTGFTQSGATQVCLNPSTTTLTSPNATELACATATNGAVWSGSSLTVSPTAGLFGQSAGDTSGILAAGRKRNFNLNQCRFLENTTLVRAHSVIDNTDFDANTTASNATGSSSCTTSNATWGTSGAQVVNSVEAFNLFAKRYVNLHQCRWTDLPNNLQVWQSSAPDNDWNAGTNTSNTADSAAVCSAGGPGFTAQPANSGAQPLDILQNRYINLHQCRYRNPSSAERITALINDTGGDAFRSGTNASNTADTTRVCTTTTAWPAATDGNGVQAVDLLDTTRGKGYVQYSITAPATPTPAFCTALGTNPVTPEGFSQSTALTSSAGAVSATGSLSVDWTQLSNPCPGNVANSVDPQVGLLVAGTLALAGAGVATTRRRRSTLA